MSISTPLVNSVGIISAINQTIQSSLDSASAGIPTSSLTSQNVVNKIDDSIQKRNDQIDFFLDQLIVLDGNKIDEDECIKKLDVSILTEVENVNDKLKDLKTTYQNRINAGVTTDLFWRITKSVTGITTSTYGDTSYRIYELECVKTSPNGYPAISLTGKTEYTEYEVSLSRFFRIPLPPLDDGKTLYYIISSGINSIRVDNLPPLGYQYDNLYGLKYYDQPYSVDILDTYVSSFVGSISAGSTVLTVNQLQESGVVSRFKIGQNIICNKDSVFPSGNEIVGISTKIINLDYTIEKIPATASASISTTGFVQSIIVNNPGFGYSESFIPSVTIQSPSGNQTIGTAIVSSAGTIANIVLSNPGLGYTFAPVIIISNPYKRSSAGYGLTGFAGIVTDVVITDAGYGYTIAPSVTFQDPPAIGVGIGTTATGISNINSSGIVTSVTITNPGYGYTVPVAITFSNPGFTTATATATVSVAGTINSILITNPGYGYTTDSEYPPIVQFGSPEIVGASATAVVSVASTILKITITNPGAGYTFSPSVTIQSPYNDVVPILYLNLPASDNALYPEDDGKFVTFTVLSSSEEITSIASTSIAIPFGSNPYSPETIGIMKSNQTGIGVSIKYDNSGYPDTVQSWRPETETDGFSFEGVQYSPPIKEPLVGSGRIFYNDGFTVKPRYPTNTSYTAWRDAVEGDTLTLEYKIGYISYYDFYFYTLPPPLSSFVTPCNSDTGGYNTAVTSAQNIVNTAKSEIVAGLSSLNQKILVSNIIRKQRNQINIQIWSQRQLIGTMLQEIAEYKDTKSALNNSEILDIIDG